MTLYTALMRTRFADNGWVIVFPDGTEENYEFIEMALGEIMVNQPEMVTAEVKSMTYFTESPQGDNRLVNDDGYFKIELRYGFNYRGDMLGILEGYDASISIKETMHLLGYDHKMADDLTLGEINRIADIAGVTGNDVLAHIGF